MINSEVTPTSHGEFLQDFTEKVGEAKIARLFAMQLEVLPGDSDDSTLLLALTALMKARERGADARLVLDMRYASHMTRVNNRDFPNWWPLLNKDERDTRRANAATTVSWIKKLQAADALDGLAPRTQSNAHATTSRIVASRHLAQHWATVHQKGGVLLGDNPGLSSTTLTTGNLTSSDVDLMNNLAVRFDGQRGQQMGQFVTQLLTPEASLRSAGGHIWKESSDDWITLIHDYNNVGDPARLPFIHVAAEKLIDPKRDECVIDGELATPKPECIVYTSQYLPDGKLALMLRQAEQNGATVVIPKQPRDDYRAVAFPYNLLTQVSSIRKDSGIDFPVRDRPSHAKSLVAKYDDNTATILFGSDNYLTHLQKVVRNEELAVLMHISPNSEEQVGFYKSYLQTLRQAGEIDDLVHKKLMIDL